MLAGPVIQIVELAIEAIFSGPYFAAVVYCGRKSRDRRATCSLSVIAFLIMALWIFAVYRAHIVVKSEFKVSNFLIFIVAWVIPACLAIMFDAADQMLKRFSEASIF